MGTASAHTAFDTIDAFNAGVYAPDPSDPAADASGAYTAASAAAPPGAGTASSAPAPTATSASAAGGSGSGGSGPSAADRQQAQEFRTIGRVAGEIGRWGKRANQTAAHFPTPGGIMPLVFILVVLLWAIVPVGANGATRLKLLWLVLTGQAGMPGVVYRDGTAIGGYSGTSACGPAPNPANYFGGATDPQYLAALAAWLACVNGATSTSQSAPANAPTSAPPTQTFAAQPVAAQRGAGGGPFPVATPGGPLSRYGDLSRGFQLPASLLGKNGHGGY